jgi:uncharacterized repeat protein (TIGR03803 family)
VTPAGGGGFYVATDGGGASNLGTLSLIRKDGTSQVLHSFIGGSDGQNADGAPTGGSDGYIYGPTQFGGGSGCGTIYRYSPTSGAYNQLYAFKCAPDGAFPFAGLTAIGDGFIGTSYDGGSDDDGSLIYGSPDGWGSSCSFSATDGAHPYASFLIGSDGNTFYTVATMGGSANLGTLMSFDRNCHPTVIHSFSGGSSDGATPYGSLLFYKNFLYGTTSGGGGPGLGTVFKVKLDGSVYSVLHQFQGIFNNSDGSFPHSGLTLNKVDGMLYGTTINGGNSSDNGTVFKIDPKSGAETVVHAFSGSDGAHPYGNLYIKKGTVYGTTLAGGASNLGVVFKLKS